MVREQNTELVTAVPVYRTFVVAHSTERISINLQDTITNLVAERIIDRLRLFDPPDSGQSTRYSVSLDLENEDSDWSFEVTVTVEF